MNYVRPHHMNLGNYMKNAMRVITIRTVLSVVGNGHGRSHLRGTHS